MGNYDQAVSDLRRSRTLDDNPVTTVVLAKAHLWAGRDEEAIDELQRARQHAEAPLEASTLLEATYRRLGRSELLERFYAETLATFPKSVFWLNRAGAFALDQGQCDQGEQLYEKACRLQQQAGAGLPTSQSSWDVQYAAALDGYLRALVLAVGDSTGPTGHPEKLDRILQEGRKYADTAYAALAFFRMAEAYKKSGDVEAALDYCRRAVEKAWASERLAVEVLLRVYMMMGGQEVSKFCRERLDKDPDSLAANFTMFNLAKIENDYGDAITYIDTCIRLAGPDSEQGLDYLIKKAQLLTVAHKATSDNGYLRKAVVVYESLHEKMPKNSSVLNNLAYMLALSDQRLTEALEYARKAVEQEPDEANYLDTYAYVLHRNGRNAEAAESIAAAIQQYEVKAAAPAEVYEHLGMVSEALGERDKALAAYRRALEMGADTPSGGARERIRAAIDRLGR